MKDALKKFNSDRLWVVLGYLALVFANTWWEVGIPDATMTEIMYVVIAFVLGKSLRGTVGGSLLETGQDALTEIIEVKRYEAQADKAEDPDGASKVKNLPPPSKRALLKRGQKDDD